MFRINGEHLPKGIIYHLSYILYYSFIWYVFLLFTFLGLALYDTTNKMSDYQLFVLPIFFAVPLGIMFSVIITPIEKKITKRNIFVVGLITILKKHKSIKFSKIIEDYSYFVFQNRKVTSTDNEWASYTEALIALGIIELKNQKALKEKSKDFDYRQFNDKFFDAELSLKDKKVNIDELIKRMDSFVL